MSFASPLAGDSLDTIFKLTSALVLPGWILLILAPRWRWTHRYATFAVTLILAAVYVALLATGPRVAGAGFNSLAQVAALFSVKQALLAGWIHYLAFDLFIGAWEARDGVRAGFSRWLLAPFLVMTFLLGPLGLGAYLLLRLALLRRVGAWMED